MRRLGRWLVEWMGGGRERRRFQVLAAELRDAVFSALESRITSMTDPEARGYVHARCAALVRSRLVAADAFPLAPAADRSALERALQVLSDEVLALMAGRRRAAAALAALPASYARRAA